MAAPAVNGDAGAIKKSKLSKGQLKALKAKEKKEKEEREAAAAAAAPKDAAESATEVKQEEDAPSTSRNGGGGGGKSDAAAAAAAAAALVSQYDENYDQVMADKEHREDRKPARRSRSPLADGTAASDEVPEEYRAILAKFQAYDDDDAVKAEGEDEKGGKGHIYYSDDEAMSEEDEEAAAAALELSKRKQKKLNRLSVAELKRLVKRPDVVDWVDVSALDPRLLIHLKSYKNSIPVPPHWSAKRDYLAGKKGIEKAAFELPGFILDTGIASQRDAIKEKEEGQSLKAKTRERVQPKMGKIDIDYQKLHDAFFKFQTKPPMTDFGEMYYEGKEYETNLKEKKPGELSQELKEALSIPPLAPPPWLIAMQRFGPPPSYRNLRIPGLNAPIPEGSQWGFHPGGWGKPPVDEFNRPLFGDVFGVALAEDQGADSVDKTLWGELEPDLEESDEEEEEEEEEEEDQEDAQRYGQDGALPPGGMETPSSLAHGMETPSGFQSVASTVPGGLETPDFLELRKRREDTTDTDAGGPPKQLYQVLPESQASVRGLLGSDRVYDTRNVASGNVAILGVDERGQKRKAAQQAAVALSIDAAELEGLSEAELRAKYEAARQSNTATGAGQGGREDFSDFVAEETAKRRKLQEQKRTDRNKKDNFKF